MTEQTQDELRAIYHQSRSIELAKQLNNLAMMLRRMIWMANKETGDTSMKVLAGKAAVLMDDMGLESSPLRDGNWIAEVFQPLPEEEAELLRDYGP